MSRESSTDDNDLSFRSVGSRGKLDVESISTVTETGRKLLVGRSLFVVVFRIVSLD